MVVITVALLYRLQPGDQVLCVRQIGKQRQHVDKGTDRAIDADKISRAPGNRNIECCAITFCIAGLLY